MSLLDMRRTTALRRPRHLCSGAALRFHNTVILFQKHGALKAKGRTSISEARGWSA